MNIVKALAPDEFLEPQARPRVLIVEDDELLARGLATYLGAGDDPCVVCVVNNGAAALEVLEEQTFDVVITDVQMPIMDGIELLTNLLPYKGSMAFVVMSASVESKQRLPPIGSRLLFIEKPVNLRELRRHVHTVFADAAHGDVAGIQLATFVQLMMQERATLSLVVVHEGHEGLLHMVAGSIVDAQLQDLEPALAAMVMVSWDNARIQIRRGARVRQDAISMRADYLVFEAVRRKDEGTLPVLKQPQAVEAPQLSIVVDVDMGVDVDVDMDVDFELAADERPQAASATTQAAPTPSSRSEDVLTGATKMNHESIAATARRLGATAVAVAPRGAAPILVDAFPRPALERAQHFERLAGLLGKELGFSRLTDLYVGGRERSLIVHHGAEGSVMVETSADADITELLRVFAAELP